MATLSSTSTSCFASSSSTTRSACTARTVAKNRKTATSPGRVRTSPAPRYDTDYAPQDWVISLDELLRVIQFYNSLAITTAPPKRPKTVRTRPTARQRGPGRFPGPLLSSPLDATRAHRIPSPRSKHRMSTDVIAEPYEHSSLWLDAWRRLRKNRLSVVGLAILSIVLLASVAGPWFSPYAYDEQDTALGASAPSASALARHRHARPRPPHPHPPRRPGLPAGRRRRHLRLPLHWRALRRHRGLPRRPRRHLADARW
jgi:hypothetical protein